MSSRRINLNKLGSPVHNDSIEIAELPPKRPRRGKLEKLESKSTAKLQRQGSKNFKESVILQKRVQEDM